MSQILNNIKSGSGKSSECLVAIVVHIDLLGDPAETEMVGDHQCIHPVVLRQIWVGFFELPYLLRTEDVDFPLEPAQAATLPECIDQAVPVDGGSFQTDHHIAELHGIERRHDSF